MNAIFNQHRINQIVGVEIGVCVFIDPEIRTDSSDFLLLDNHLIPSVVPHDLPAGSSFLGYDVADGSLISGISNCGYDSTEIRTLRATWSSSLNGNGLIGTLDSAMRFKSMTDARVPEHSPFWVFGIYRMP
jgi:hypothetical protein